MCAWWLTWYGPPCIFKIVFTGCDLSSDIWLFHFYSLSLLHAIVLTRFMWLTISYAMATCEINLFWNNFEIISVFYFTCNHVWNLFLRAEIKLFQTDVDEGWNNFISHVTTALVTVLHLPGIRYGTWHGINVDLVTLTFSALTVQVLCMLFCGCNVCERSTTINSSITVHFVPWLCQSLRRWPLHLKIASQLLLPMYNLRSKLTFL